MEKLKKVQEFIFGLNVSHVFVLAILLKAVISDISYAAFLATVPILGYECYKLYIKSKKPDPVVLNMEVQKNIDALRDRVDGLSMEKNVKQPLKRYF